MKAKPFFILFFAVALGLGALSYYMGMTIEKTDKTVSAVVSPDKKYKAVKVTLASNGAAPFCFDSISVMLAVYPDDFAERNKAYEIYSAPCDTPANRAASPKIEWLSNSAVTISYAATSAAGFNEKKAVMKPLDVTKYVHVTFVAHDK